MDCPGCGVEMVDLPGDDQTLRKCGECGGLWVDVSDLNRILLHSNLPGLDALGGRMNPDTLSGQCPECQVDLVQVEGGDKAHPNTFQACESCGGVFLEADFQDVEDRAAAQKVIVAFFREFSVKKKKVAAS